MDPYWIWTTLANRMESTKSMACSHESSHRNKRREVGRKRERKRNDSTLHVVLHLPSNATATVAAARYMKCSKYESSSENKHW